MKSVNTQLIQALEITNLPTLPHVLLKVLDICNSESASLQAIADILSKDAALCAKVIGASSTAQFNRPHVITTLEQKLALLGLDMVKTIVISSSFYQVFNNFNLSPGFDLKTFWGQSLTTAFIAKQVAQEVAYPRPEEAYLTGLLLNIGQLVLWGNFPRQYAQLLADKTDYVALMSQESEKLGNNHCEVGAWLVNSWHLNSFMADAVLYHHMPQENIVDAHPLIQIAYLANRLATDQDMINPQMAAEPIANLSAAVLHRIVNNTEELVNQVAQSLGIEINTPDKNEPDGMRQQKMQLAMELRDIVLIGRNPLGAGAPVSLNETLSSIQRSVQILFGIQNVVFFMPDHQGSTLNGLCLTGQCAMLNEISVPFNRLSSIVTEAFLTKTPIMSFSDVNKPGLSIVDEQIIRLMQTEGLYCLPLTFQHIVVGVMIFGLSQTQLSYVKKQQKLLTMFAQQAAQAITLVNTFAQQEARIKSEIMAATRAQTLQTVHEANNPLSIIHNYIQLLGLRLPKDDAVQEDLKIIREEIDRVTRICHVVTSANEAQAHPHQELNVNDVIQNLCRIFLEPMFALHQAHVETRLDETLPRIMTNKDKLIQVMINLMKNAAEAMPNGGQLLITTRQNTLRNNREYIEISLKDDGPGIPVEIMENLFKPVTSRKGAGHAGLGLSIVKRIVEELDGKIFCHSNEMSGTLFQILLPRHSDKSA